MFNNNKIPQSGLIPIKIENQGNLLTTQVNKINFTGSGVTTTAGNFNDVTVLIDSTGYYGAFCSTGSQTNLDPPNVSRSMVLETTEHSVGVSIVSGSRITVANSGVYNLQFSAQIEKTSNGTDTIYVWFKKNGSNILRSNTGIDVTKQAGSSGKVVAAWNYIDTLIANDYLEIIWQSADPTMILAYEPESGNLPSIPSVIATLTQL
jgi:hypothetical protein